ncbi:hypothetical protein EV286_11219 [Rhizobium sp. BK251]|nr:hypothetical protein EV286_11219 [Rhizobium sp. BK251]
MLATLQIATATMMPDEIITLKASKTNLLGFGRRRPIV